MCKAICFIIEIETKFSVFPQIRPGSGWVLEPYNGDPNRTLVSHIVHVSCVHTCSRLGVLS